MHFVSQIYKHHHCEKKIIENTSQQWTERFVSPRLMFDGINFKTVWNLCK